MAHVVGVQHLGEIGLVQHHADVLFNLVKSGAPVIRTQHRHRAAVPAGGVHNELDGGAFACTVFTHQSHDAAGGQRQVKAVQPEAGVLLHQSFYLDGVQHSSSFPFMSHMSRSISTASSSVSEQPAARSTIAFM